MGSEQVNKRIANQGALLRGLHFDGPLRRGEISDRYGIRKSSVTSIVADLLSFGIIEEERPGSSRSSLRLRTAELHAVAATVTAGNIQAARVYLDGRVEFRARMSVPAEASSDAVVKLLVAGLNEFVRSGAGKILGVGVAVPGVIDPAQGLCLQAVNLPGWKNIPLGDRIGQQVGRPVCVDNDVRCQLWSSMWFDRLDRDAENVIYLHVHEGVACAIMNRGRLIVGERFSAGEIGHVKAGDEGRVCSCGRTDCLETYCSVPAICRELGAVTPGPGPASASEIVKASGDAPVVGRVLDRVGWRLGRAMAGLVAAVDPHTIVLGTSNRAFSELLRPSLQRHLYDELMGLQSGAAAIRSVDDVETSSLRGAAGLVIDRAFSTGEFSLRPALP